MSAALVSGGLGGRVYSANGRVIRVEPKETRKTHNVSSWSLGFQFATLEEYVEPDNAAELVAEYLSCPKRAAAPELYEALETVLAMAQRKSLTGPMNLKGQSPYDIGIAALRKARGGALVGNALNAARAALNKASQ